MKELLFSVTKKDFEIKWFSGKGAGGQSRNKNQMCVRLHHPHSGASSTGQSHKSREQNLREAFNTLIKSPKFRAWYQQKIWQALNEVSIEELVQEQMKPENLKVEGKDDRGRWSTESVRISA
jgi:protein subunit release factor B